VPPAHTEAPWGLGSVVVAFVVGYLLASLLGGVAVAAGAGKDGTATTALTLVGLWVGFAGVPVVLARTRGRGRLADDFGLRFGGPADLGLGVIGGLAAYGFLLAYGAVLAQFDRVDLGRGTDRLAGHGHGLGLGFGVFALAVAVGAPIVEELYFRGLVQPALQRRLGAVAGLVITAVLFGLLHLGDNPPEAMVPLAAFGLVVGLLAWRKGRLGPGIVAHITFNGITVVVLALSR